MARSRLSKKMEQRTKKNFALSILGITVTMFLILRFGIPILANLSLFLSGTKNDQEQSKIQDMSFIAPPTLDSLPQATSSAGIIISGISSKNQVISLYINDVPINKTNTKDDGTFLFKDAISPGENIIKVKAVVGKKESEYSQSLIIFLKNAPPSLSVNSPTEGQSFSKDQNTVDVRGTTDTDVKVTVNGFWAITDTNGNFSYSLHLQNGENRVKITATDIAGNRNDKELKITYSP